MLQPKRTKFRKQRKGRNRGNATVANKVSFLKYFWQSWPGLVLAWGLTQLTVFFSWIFFRLPNLNEAIRRLRLARVRAAGRDDEPGYA